MGQRIVKLASRPARRRIPLYRFSLFVVRTVRPIVHIPSSRSCPLHVSRLNLISLLLLGLEQHEVTIHMGVQVNKFFLDKKVLYHFPTAIAAIEEHGINSMLVQRPSEGCRIRLTSYVHAIVRKFALENANKLKANVPCYSPMPYTKK